MVRLGVSQIDAKECVYMLMFGADATRGTMQVTVDRIYPFFPNLLLIVIYDVCLIREKSRKLTVSMSGAVPAASARPVSAAASSSRLVAGPMPR